MIPLLLTKNNSHRKRRELFIEKQPVNKWRGEQYVLGFYILNLRAMLRAARSIFSIAVSRCMATSVG